MIGMRWWIEHNEDGKEKWVFESKGDPKLLNKYDVHVFWTS